MMAIIIKQEIGNNILIKYLKKKYTNLKIFINFIIKSSKQDINIKETLLRII